MSLRTGPLTGAIMLAILLAGCAGAVDVGGTDRSPAPDISAPQGDELNAADEEFLTAMIPHHEQAIEMADLVLAKDEIDATVRDLAEQIKESQGPEIDAMKQLLDEAGAPYDPEGMTDMDHGNGMMSDDAMDELRSATGRDAVQLFLEGMIDHHTGAIDMASELLDTGESTRVAELAQTIIDAQTEEITTMEGLLRSI